MADRCDRLDLSSSGVAGALLSFGVCCDRGFKFRAVLPPFARVSCTVNSAPFLPICCFLLERISVELISVLFRIASSHLSVVIFVVVVLLLRSTKFVRYLPTNETSALASNCVPVLALILPLPFPPCYSLLNMPLFRLEY